MRRSAYIKLNSNLVMKSFSVISSQSITSCAITIRRKKRNETGLICSLEEFAMPAQAPLKQNRMCWTEYRESLSGDIVWYGNCWDEFQELTVLKVLFLYQLLSCPWVLISGRMCLWSLELVDNVNQKEEETVWNDLGIRGKRFLHNSGIKKKEILLICLTNVHFNCQLCKTSLSRLS